MWRISSSTGTIMTSPAPCFYRSPKQKGLPQSNWWLTVTRPPAFCSGRRRRRDAGYIRLTKGNSKMNKKITQIRTKMNISKNIQGYPVKCAGVRKNKRINSACIMCDIFDIKKYYTKSTWRISGINQCIMNRM